MLSYARGAANLEAALRRQLDAWDPQLSEAFFLQQQLLASLADERRLASLSPQARDARERILWELNRLCLRALGHPFLDLCSKEANMSAVASTEIAFHDAAALLVGVGSYVSPLFGDLPATARDASTLASLLVDPKRCGYPPGAVRLLTGNAATAASLRIALRELAERTTASSTALFFFSGHGAQVQAPAGWHSFLCGRDADPALLATTALGREELMELLRRVEAGRLLIVLDACHAAGAADPKSIGKASWKAGLSEADHSALSRGRGRVVFASSAADQVSWVRPEGDLSLFTFHLCRALGGAASVRGENLVRVLDVFDFVSTEVQRAEPRQTPILKVDDLDLNFPIALTGVSATTKGGTLNGQLESVRAAIIANPENGARALSDALRCQHPRPGLREEVDLKRAELKEIDRDLRLFGRSDELLARRNRAVFFLLQTCSELARS